MARDLSYRRNQWPAGVTLIRVDGRYAALRIRPSGVGLRRKPGGGEWEPVVVTGASRVLRPWVVKISRAEGPDLMVRPFRPGEAGMPDVGRRVGRGSSGDTDDGTDLPDLGDDPVSAVAGILWLAFSVLAAPFLVVGGFRRVRAAGRLREDLRATIAVPGRPA